jgi:pSer/pThr/pTyr-binding forkhead associated (FHA) protein/signal transduction histidine kinase
MEALGVLAVGAHQSHCYPFQVVQTSEFTSAMSTYVILQELSSGNNHRVELPCVFGRGTEANLELADPAISRRHAVMSEAEDLIWIEDLDSLNGVYVNGHKIYEKTRLHTGDAVKLGQVEFRLCNLEEEPKDQTVILQSVGTHDRLELDRQKLDLIHEITLELTENQDQTVLGNKIFNNLKELFQQDQAYMGLFQEDGALRTIFSDPDVPRVPVSKSIINRLFQNGESFLLTDALDEESLKEQESVLALRIRSALCVPLIFRNQIYGLIYLARNVPGAYGQHDLEFLRTIASILAPLVENARLWSEIKKHYASAMETLRETQARLLEMERTAAYVRLAQAVAHEIRNPLMVIGGLVKRMMPSGAADASDTNLYAIMSAVERIDMVLKEVDRFVRFPSAEKKLERVDSLIQAAIDVYCDDWGKLSIHPALSVNTPHLMIPLDRTLFSEALAMLFRDVLTNLRPGSDLEVVIRDAGNCLEIVIGGYDNQRPLAEFGDAALHNKPWSLGLYLNLAQKIISDHGGKLLVDPDGHSALPMIIRLLRIGNR